MIRGQGKKNRALRLEMVLTSWLAAVADFHHYHKQVSWYLSQVTLQETSPASEKIWLGQCSAKQLVSLHDTMRSELEKLLAEIDQLEQRPIDEKCEKLLNHTRLLEQFNRRSNVLLQLASLTAC